jgi:predicted ester cyclase
MLAEGHYVVSRAELHGVHKGELDGIPPTGKKFCLKGFTIFRLDKGRIVEEWEIFDELGLMMQIGMELQVKKGSQ